MAEEESSGGTLPKPSVWVLTDGKIGDDVQCVAVAKALAPSFSKRVIAPRAPFVWTAPWGVIDPRDSADKAGSPIEPPFPDIVIASGRRAIPYARAVKQASSGKVFIVLMKNPRISLRHADVVWAPEHDELSAPKVITTLTSPHGFASSLADSRENPAPEIAKLPKPLLGIVLGGPSGGARYDERVATEFAEQVRGAAKAFASVAITPSRRTPGAFLRRLRELLGGEHVYFWDRKHKNPYTDILANSDSLIVTADSHNMMSEAVATGTGIYAYRPPGLAQKLDRFVSQLEKSGAVRGFEGGAEPFSFTPIDSTPIIVREIRKRFAAH